MNFSNRLIKWYLENKRNLPWRNIKDPYKIWLSEIILQQTRVAQGLPYYIAFLEAFPTVFDLAKANEEQVLKLWQGLGYYSRARNLHYTSQTVVNEFNGVFPTSYKELLKLKGVGTYTAAAIASFSVNQKVPVVDGNVFRVLSRFFDVENDISDLKTKSIFFDLALNLIPENKADVFNQAIMEFGALYCVPKKTNCANCIFNDSCLAYKKNKVEELPFKGKKTKVVNRFFNYIVIEDNLNKTFIVKRTQKGIWLNLYEFPLIETTTVLNLEQFIGHLNVNFNYKIKSVSASIYNSVKHKLSHQNLNIDFWHVKIDGVLLNSISKFEAKKHPFPIVIFNFIEKNF